MAWTNEETRRIAEIEARSRGSADAVSRLEGKVDRLTRAILGNADDGPERPSMITRMDRMEQTFKRWKGWIVTAISAVALVVAERIKAWLGTGA